MTRKEAKNFNWFNNDREAIEKHIDKIYDDFNREIGDYFRCPYVQMYAGSNYECRFCGRYDNEKHKDGCLHIKFKEFING